MDFRVYHLPASLASMYIRHINLFFPSLFVYLFIYSINYMKKYLRNRIIGVFRFLVLKKKEEKQID